MIRDAEILRDLQKLIAVHKNNPLVHLVLTDVRIRLNPRLSLRRRQ
jgi:hypothetical protein